MTTRVSPPLSLSLSLPFTLNSLSNSLPLYLSLFTASLPAPPPPHPPPSESLPASHLIRFFSPVLSAASSRRVLHLGRPNEFNKEKEEENATRINGKGNSQIP